MIFDDIRGKKVLVTGSASGIGACTAELFAHYGAIVGIHYHNHRQSADQLLKKIESLGGEGVLIKADLTDYESWTGIVPEFIRSTGGIDVLINNAGGIYGHSHFLEMDIQSWENTMKLNLGAPFFLAKTAFKHMQNTNGGSIINITSIAAYYGGSANSIHYGAAKGGLETVTKTLAREGAEYNIRVNAIRPGVIDTPFHKKIKRDSLEERIKWIPLKRAGAPIDVSQLCLFLSSDCGNFITGQIYGVTGGE